MKAPRVVHTPAAPFLFAEPGDGIMALGPERLPEGSLAVFYIARLKADAPACGETTRHVVEPIEAIPDFSGRASWCDE